MSIKEEVSNRLGSIPEEERAGAMDSLTQYGCVSGSVNCLIYYSQTQKFFERNKAEINDLLSGEDLSATSLPQSDTSDPLCLEQNNQNLLAWFGFEVGASRLHEGEAGHVSS